MLNFYRRKISVVSFSEYFLNTPYPCLILMSKLRIFY